MGMAQISEDTLKGATYIEQLMINEVVFRREHYLESRVLKSELVERKR